MIWICKREHAATVNPQELSKELAGSVAKNGFLLASIQTLLQFIHDFALDIKELHSDIFKRNLNALESQFGQDPKLKSLRSSFRKHQKRIRRFIARYGGEEFIIVLSKGSLPKVVKKAKRICEAIAKNRYSLEDIKAGHILDITVSIGISAYHYGDTAPTIIARADQALYNAKRAGKNRVMSENEWARSVAANSA